MPSTRSDRARRLAPLLALAIPVVGIATCSVLAPEPSGPRYLGAGGGHPRRGGVLRTWHESDLRTLDPAAAFDEISNVAIDLLFDTLLTYDEDQQLAPRLLAEMPRVEEGGRVFILALRPDVRFHDGSTLDAEDVRFSLERMLSPALGSPAAGFFTNVRGVTAFRAGRAARVDGLRVLDGRTRRVELVEPDATFLHLLTLGATAPVPREAYTERDRSFDPVGAGPFRFERLEPGVRVVVRRHEGYWDPGRPWLDAVVYELNLQRGPAYLRFANGELEVLHRQTAADLLALKASKAWDGLHTSFGTGETWGLEMNTELPPFDDVHVRRAVAFAVDRERWARTRNFRLAPLGQPLPPGFPGHDPALPEAQHFDLSKAREEMRLAGYPDGLPDPVDLWVGEGLVGRQYGELAQADLARIGIQVRIKQVSFSVYLAETRKRRSVAFFLGGWTPDYPDPSTFLDSLFHSRATAPGGATNKAYYASPQVDTLLDAARREVVDPARRGALYREASGIIAADAPWAFAFTQTASAVWQPYVRGYRPNTIEPLPFRDVWLDLPRRRPASGVAVGSPLLETRRAASGRWERR